MKYMETGKFQNQPLMKLTLGFTLLFIIGLWITNFLLYFSKMNLLPSSVVDYYLGSKAAFTLPRTFQSMLEVTHSHLPMMAIVILLLTHLIIFAPFKNNVKVIIIAGSFLSALLSETSGWLVRFVSPHFAVLKVGSFLIFQGLLIYLIAALGIFLAKSPMGSKSRHSTSKSKIN